MPSSTSTPAAKRRAAARKATRGAARRGHTAPAKPKSKAKTAPKRAPAKRAPRSTRTAPPKRRLAPKRATTKRAAPKRSRARRSLPRPPLKTSVVVVVLAVATLTAAYFLWFRNSSLVAVDKVEVAGLSSPDSPQIEAALTKTATSMTTLKLDQARLEKAVASFPTVVSVSAHADFPHGLAIDVTERPPVLLAEAKGETVPVGPDGVLLPGLELGEAADSLPVLAVDALPPSGKLEGDALSKALVLGAAPAPLRPLIEKVAIEDGRGVEVTMRGGIPIRFGGPEEAAAKWAAAAAVLADPKTETLTYVDVRVPERPALGGAETPAVEEDPAVDPAVTAPVEPVTGTEAVEPTL